MTTTENNGINFDQHQADADTLPTKAALIPNLASPNKAQWVTCNPAFQTELTCCKGQVGATGMQRTYLINGKDEHTHKKLIQNLDNTFRANCVLYTTPNKYWGIWPIKRTEPGKEPHMAHVTSQQCFEDACESFVKIRYKDHAEGWVSVKPEDEGLFRAKLSQIEWPEEDEWHNILNRAFKGNIISDEEHYVYKSAVGRHV